VLVSAISEGDFEQTDNSLDGPVMVRDPCFHRWRHAQRPMLAPDIVEDGVARHHRGEVKFVRFYIPTRVQQFKADRWPALTQRTRLALTMLAPLNVVSIPLIELPSHCARSVVQLRAA
jgi:hypothetical protein